MNTLTEIIIGATLMVIVLIALSFAIEVIAPDRHESVASDVEMSRPIQVGKNIYRCKEI